MKSDIHAIEEYLPQRQGHAEPFNLTSMHMFNRLIPVHYNSIPLCSILNLRVLNQSINSVVLLTFFNIWFTVTFMYTYALVMTLHVNIVKRSSARVYICSVWWDRYTHYI